jgi:ankyrin repeat protein
MKTSKPELISTLLKFYSKNHVNLNATDNKGFTCVHTATSLFGKTPADEEVLKLILATTEIQWDIDTNDKDTILHFFCENFGGTNVYDLGKAVLQKNPLAINKKNSKGETPLHLAVANGQSGVHLVKMLIDSHANVNAVSEIGESGTSFHVIKLFFSSSLLCKIHSS